MPGRPNRVNAGGRLGNDEYAITHPVWPAARAGRDVLEAAADELAGRHLDVPAEDDRRHQALPQLRVRVDLAPDQPDQHRRALRVPDQDERPAVVVVRQVVAPAGEQALERDLGRLLVAGDVEQPGDGLLAVDRRPDPADPRELRGLLDGGVHLDLLDVQVRVRRLLVAHGRIDVEAVEP